MPFPKEDGSNNEEKDDHTEVDTTETDGNKSDSEYKIMLEDEDADHSVIDIESVNRKTTTISGRVVTPQAILKDYETGVASLDRYEKAVTLTTAEEKFYSQMKELNELQLFSNNGIPCLEELDSAYEAGLLGAALGDIFYHTSELKVMNYKEYINTHEKPYWGYAVYTEHKKFVENCVLEARYKNKVPPDAKIISST